MKNKTKRSKSSGIFWRIAISAVGVALVVISLGNLSLFFGGKSTTAAITTRRIAGSDDNRPANQRYQWSVDYTFSDLQGNTHSGHTSRRGSDMAVKVETQVYYFSFAPYISALEKEAEPNIGQPVLIVIGLFLIFAMNKNKKKARRTEAKHKAVITPDGKIDVPDLADYNDSVEEVFHNKTE